MEPKNTPGGVDFARAVAFYPGCRVPLETGRWASRVPLMVLIGATNDWTPAAPCADLAAQAKTQGEKVDIVVYPDAYHDFDQPDLPVHTVDGLAFTANGGGSTQYRDKSRGSRGRHQACRRFSRALKGSHPAKKDAAPCLPFGNETQAASLQLGTCH